MQTKIHLSLLLPLHSMPQGAGPCCIGAAHGAVGGCSTTGASLATLLTGTSSYLVVLPLLLAIEAVSEARFYASCFLLPVELLDVLLQPAQHCDPLLL
jgi:hypothetical protein